MEYDFLLLFINVSSCYLKIFMLAIALYHFQYLYLMLNFSIAILMSKQKEWT